MKIRLLIVGKIENQHTKALAEMYEKRIRHYLPIRMEAVKPEKIKSLSDAEILHREGQKLLGKLNPGDANIVLDKDGVQFSSEEFAVFFANMANHSIKQATFIIGGPLGLAKEVKKKGYKTISFGRMTLPHELSAVVLLEQIYRAHSILKNEKYHK